MFGEALVFRETLRLMSLSGKHRGLVAKGLKEEMYTREETRDGVEDDGWSIKYLG